MHGTLPRPLTALVFVLTLGTVLPAAQPLSAPVRAYHLAQQPRRISLAQDHLMALRPALGLGEQEGFRPTNAFTNAEGEAIVRLDHTFAGHRVVGSQAIAKVPLGGTIRALTHHVISQVKVSGSPTLTPATATAIALQHLDPKGPMQESPKVEQVVFPSRFLGGIATAVDATTGKTMVDRKLTVLPRLDEPFVWAYEVRTHLQNAQDGRKELTYYIDARTGKILRVNDSLERQAVAPATGTGRGYYSGTVTSIPTSLMLDGTYALYDTTRGTLPNPYLGSFTPDASGWSATGLQAWYQEHDATGATTWNTFLFQANPDNTWGDGLPFTAWGQENGRNGQSAGVDAMVAMATTWDFFKNVLGRDGMDGKGTSVFAQVLATSDYDVDNAYWSDWSQGLVLGAGSYPANPKGFGAFTEFDVVAHEMAHGVTSSTAKFVNAAGYEEAGLNEATSDFFAQMAKAYASAAPGATVPDSGADWKIGAGAGRGTPLRWMDKPSKDQRSADGWYDGVLYMDGHFSAGILNRALYFLAHGASSTPGADDYSPYLPQGMTGIGNDKAARIWFKTVTERLYSGNMGQVTFMDAREQAIQAALQLYGESAGGWGLDSLTSHAVENAFAAVNVGRAYGEPPRTQVLFADWRDNDWIQRNHFSDIGYSHKQFLPIGETVHPRITVLNNPNTAVTWTLGGPSLYNGSSANKGGVLNADGSWTTPTNLGWYAITATSQADPRQFAEGRAFLVNLDTDGDNEQDAVDLGSIAFSWYLTNGLNPAHSMFNAPWVDDADVAAFADAMKATWWVK